MKIIRRRVQKTVEGPSMTKQAFKDECDINKIIAKYQRTQQLTHVNSIKGVYGDFDNVSDYHAAYNAVLSAQEKFMGLSAQVRAKFQNDPAQLIKFIEDDKNYEEALNLGLLDDEKAKAYLESKKPKEPTTPAPSAT